MNIGEAIKQIRKEAGMSQHNLAAASGITQTGISQIERCVRHPHGASIALIAKALNISVAALYVRSITTEDIKNGERDNPHVIQMFEAGKELLLKTL